MNKHTEGPWKAEENRVFQIKHPTFRVAICTSNISDYSEETANAALIAAAPDLLDACKRMMERLDTLTTEEFSCGGEKPERGLIQAAINKAEATP